MRKIVSVLFILSFMSLAFYFPGSAAVTQPSLLNIPLPGRLGDYDTIADWVNDNAGFIPEELLSEELDSYQYWLASNNIADKDDGIDEFFESNDPHISSVISASGQDATVGIPFCDEHDYVAKYIFAEALANISVDLEGFLFDTTDLQFDLNSIQNSLHNAIISIPVTTSGTLDLSGVNLYSWPLNLTLPGNFWTTPIPSMYDVDPFNLTLQWNFGGGGDVPYVIAVPSASATLTQSQTAVAQALASSINSKFAALYASFWDGLDFSAVESQLNGLFDAAQDNLNELSSLSQEMPFSFGYYLGDAGLTEGESVTIHLSDVQEAFYAYYQDVESLKGDPELVNELEELISGIASDIQEKVDAATAQANTIITDALKDLLTAVLAAAQTETVALPSTLLSAVARECVSPYLPGITSSSLVVTQPTGTATVIPKQISFDDTVLPTEIDQALNTAKNQLLSSALQELESFTTSVFEHIAEGVDTGKLSKIYVSGIEYVTHTYSLHTNPVKTTLEVNEQTILNTILGHSSPQPVAYVKAAPVTSVITNYSYSQPGIISLSGNIVKALKAGKTTVTVTSLVYCIASDTPRTLIDTFEITVTKVTPQENNNLPYTGDNSQILLNLIIIIAVPVALGIWYFVKRKRKAGNNRVK